MNVRADLGTAYLHAGVVQISVANLLLIAATLVVFVLALVVPFPKGRDDAAPEEDEHDQH